MNDEVGERGLVHKTKQKEPPSWGAPSLPSDDVLPVARFAWRELRRRTPRPLAVSGRNFSRAVQ